MPDISPINPINKVEKSDSVTSQKHLPKDVAQLSERRSISPKEASKEFDQDLIDQVNQDLNQLSANAPLSPQNLARVQAELAHLHKLPPDQLQALEKKLKENLRNVEILLKGLQKQQKMDPHIADEILSSVHQITSKDAKNFSSEEVKKLGTTLDTLQHRVKQLSSDRKIDPEVGNVLVLFLAFAKTQMDQNDKAMLAGIDQTKVKTAQLDLQSQKQKDIINESTTSKHISTTNCLLISAGLAIFSAILGIFTGGLGAVALGAMAGASIAVIAIGGTYGYAKDQLDDPSVSGIVEEGLDDKKIFNLQTLMSYLDTKVKSLSSTLGFTEKMYVENVSEKSMQLGQQAGQAIRELGDMMKHA